jgi:phage N-6-adenine-methyltransferase
MGIGFAPPLGFDPPFAAIADLAFWGSIRPGSFGSGSARLGLRSAQGRLGLECGMPKIKAGNTRSDHWETPRALFRSLHAEFGFTLDACAIRSNAKCRRFYSPEQDALSKPWRGVVFCNPPYGRNIIRWVRKAWEESRAGATIVCLIPASTDTTWWHDYVMRGEVRFIRGRLYFGPTEDRRSPFPSAIVVFRPTGVQA